jgi:ABC-type nitrate/sulfonate/bicarbonate transport system permease component
VTRRGADSLLSHVVQLSFFVAVLLLWFAATSDFGVSRLLLPPPVEVWQQLVDVVMTGEFIPDLEVTLTELVFAFAIAVPLGMVLGYLISRSRYMITVCEPLLAAIYSVPIILFLPLYVLIFGLGPASKIALGATIGFFPIVLNAIAGFGSVDQSLVRAARSMGASNIQMFHRVLLPAARPILLAGVRIGFTVALLSVIGSETLASLGGLGHRIVNLAENMDMARMFAYIVFVIAIVAVLNALVSRLEARAR